MRAFAERRGRAVSYFFVLDERRPVLPFGVCGPFAKRREAKTAAAKLRSAHPGALISVYGGTFFIASVTSEAMAMARVEARNKLSTMLQAATQAPSGMHQPQE